ncbi:MAG: Ig-like domain-containing protein [Methanobacterium sp.]
MVKGFGNIFWGKHVILMVFVLFFISFISVGSSFAVLSNNSSNLNVTNISNSSNSTNVTVKNNLSSIQGVYINAGVTPANTINTTALKAEGVNTVYISTDRQNPSDLQSYINKFNGTGIGVYAWVDSFKDFNGNWFNPETNTTLENEIISDIDNITMNYNVNGVMLDYLRYPGNAYLYPNATSIVDNFTAAIRSNINLVNNLNITGKPHILLSAALMPEGASNNYYYGQNYTSLAHYLDYLSPMIYVDNYGETTSWIGSTTGYIVSQANGTPVVSILQTYINGNGIDENVTTISISQMDLDIQTAVNSGSDGYEAFRYGLLPSNWTGYQPPTPTPAPVIVSTNPLSNATDVSLVTPVSIVFNENITTAAEFFDITVKNLSTGSVTSLASLNISGNTLTITSNFNRLSGDIYQVNIPAGAVESMSGNILVVWKIFNFTSMIPPVVVSTNPLENATGVSLTSPVTVKFNENITAGSAFNGIYIKNLDTDIICALSSEKINGTTLTINMSNNRLFNDVYMVVIPVDAVKDLLGDNLTSAYNFTFTTIPLLKVTTTNPLENATGVSLTSPVTVKFNENITAGSAFNGIYIKNLNTGTMVALASKNITGNTLTINSTYNRLFNDVYMVFLPVGAVTDSFGDNLTSAYNFTFTTIPLLKVTTTNPLENTTGVSLTSPVTVKFNENITAGSAFNGIYIKNLNTGTVVSLASKMINGSTLTINMSNSRLFNDLYQVYLPAGAVKDLFGDNLTSAYNFTFTTIPLLKVTNSNPLENATGVSLTSPVTVKFNDNITSGSNYNGIYIENLSTGKLVTFSKKISGNILTFTMSSSRLYDNVYRVYLPVGAVTDSFGDNLTSAYNFTFTTIPLLKVTTTNPLENATGISLTSPVTVKFNENITSGSNFNGIYIKNISTGKVMTLASEKINGSTLTIVMSRSRLYNDVYEVVIPVDAVHDVFGDNLSSAYIFTFKSVS